MLIDYDKKAAALQAATRNDESSSPQEYNRIRVRQAVVHVREDVILIVSYMSSVNEQLRSIRRILLALLITVIVVAVFRELR